MLVGVWWLSCAGASEWVAGWLPEEQNDTAVLVVVVVVCQSVVTVVVYAKVIRLFT